MIKGNKMDVYSHEACDECIGNGECDCQDEGNVEDCEAVR